MVKKHKGTCPKCRSGEILQHADASNGNPLGIRVYEKAGVTLKGMRNYPLRAWVCTKCGYTEFYVSNPHELARSYRRSLATT